MEPSLIFLVLGLSGIIAGLSTVFVGWRTARRSHESTSWPTAEGEITSSKMTKHSAIPGDDSIKVYDAKVSYRYAVGNTEYSSQTISFCKSLSSNPEQADKILQRYPAGTCIRVFYNPCHPEIAVLEPGAYWSNYLGIYIGIVITLVGAGAFLIAMRLTE